MYRYIIRRIFSLFIVLFCATFLVFGLISLAPGDPASIILGAGSTQAEIDALNHELGFDRPFLTRYLDFVINLVLHGDFGTSYRTRRPIVNEVKSRTPISFTLAFIGITAAACIGIPLGVFTAVKQYSLWDTIPTVISLMFSAMPVFWLGMLLIYFLSLKAGLFPSYGLKTWKGFILPCIAIAMIYAAQQMRYTRSSMLDSIRQDYVRTARAKGASERTVIWKHALKNALLPTITVVGSNFGALIGGAIVLENLFSIPGLGSYTITSINNRDVPALLANTLVISAIYSSILLVVDLLYAAVDPRVKARYSR